MINLHKAVKRVVAMLISRVTAYGEKWRRWYLSIQHTSKHKKVAEKFRKFRLITCNEVAEYTINPVLNKIYEELVQKDD